MSSRVRTSALLCLTVCSALLLPACAEDVGTSIRVSLVYKDGWKMSAADVVISRDGDGEDMGAEMEDDLERTTAISHELLVLVPDSLSGNVMPLEVWGVRDGERIAHGTAVALVRKGETVDATVVLDRLPCGVFCEPGDVQCSGDGISTCDEDADGCLVWSEPELCPSEAPFCSGGACASSCVDECASGEGQCVDSDTESACGDFDGDPCLDFGPQVDCSGMAVCYSGRCAAPCAHGALANTATPDSISAFTPAVAVDLAGNVHGVYSQNGTRNLRYARRSRGGGWPATWDDVGAPVTKGENPSIVADKAGGLHLLAGGTQVIYAYLPPGGNDWQVSAALETGADVGVASSLAFDITGALHAVWFRASDSQLRYAVRTGGTWSTPVNAGPAGSGARCDLTVVGTTPHVASFDLANDLWYATATGGSWTSERIVNLTGAPFLAGAAAAIAADRAGTLHVVYSDLHPSVDDLRYVFKSGATWSVPDIIDTFNDKVGAYADLAIDPFDRLHVVSRTTMAPFALRYGSKGKGVEEWDLAAQPPATSGLAPSIAIDSLGNVRVLSAGPQGSPIVETSRGCQ
jgi:hypothetical protein